MTLATTTSAPSPRRLRLTRTGYALDLTLFVIAAALCAALFFQGGFEALIGAGLGAFFSARNPKAAISGAFAGLFAGALFAAFFHDALAALV
jgi:membrane associated rhomboid family serine protease